MSVRTAITSLYPIGEKANAPSSPDNQGVAPDEVPFDAVQARLLPVADRVMLLMWSRPKSGSLRDTRVTIVTIYLALATAVVALLLTLLCLLRAAAGGNVPWVVAAVLLLLLAFGCADLGLYGIRQRLLMRRSDQPTAR